MRFESSGIVRPLSNWRRVILNKCSRFISAALPERCMLCAAPGSTHSLCARCAAELPWLPAAQCPQCAAPTPGGRVCGNCLSHPPRFDAVTAAFVYEWPLAPLIHRYKYGGTLALAGLFAHALAARGGARDGPGGRPGGVGRCAGAAAGGGDEGDGGLFVRAFAVVGGGDGESDVAGAQA